MGALIIVLTGLVVALAVVYRDELRAFLRERLVRPPAQRELGWLEDRRRQIVVVHTVDDMTIEGLLVEVSPDGVALTHASYLERETKVQLAGDVFVPRAKVALVQVPRDGVVGEL